MHSEHQVPRRTPELGTTHQCHYSQSPPAVGLSGQGPLFMSTVTAGDSIQDHRAPCHWIYLAHMGPKQRQGDQANGHRREACCPLCHRKPPETTHRPVPTMRLWLCQHDSADWGPGMSSLVARCRDARCTLILKILNHLVAVPEDLVIVSTPIQTRTRLGTRNSLHHIRSMTPGGGVVVVVVVDGI